MARVHICIDDATRVVVTGIFPDEKAVGAIAAFGTDSRLTQTKDNLLRFHS